MALAMMIDRLREYRADGLKDQQAEDWCEVAFRAVEAKKNAKKEQASILLTACRMVGENESSRYNSLMRSAIRGMLRAIDQPHDIDTVNVVVDTAKQVGYSYTFGVVKYGVPDTVTVG